MKYLEKDRFRNFITAVRVALGLLFILLGLLFYLGKTNSFIFINGRYSASADIFFQYVTFLGDGLIYIPLVLFCIFYKREYLIPAISAIIICTILSQFLKRCVFPDELNLRPISLEEQHIIIHKIEGVEMSRYNSFPSGHTSTAFTMALLLSYMVKKRVWAFILPFVALLVGYSRIYLAQHFVSDVSAGIVVGITSSFFSLLIYNAWKKRKSRSLQTH